MRNKTSIFCFHRISDEFSPAYPPIPVKVFDKICSYINRKYLVIPIEDLGSASRLSGNTAIITFDDAYYDFYENALPILRKHRLPALQNVITNSANTGESFWTQKLNKIIEEYFKEKQRIQIDELNINEELSSPVDVENAALKIYLLLLERTDKDQILENIEHNLDKEISYTRMMNWNEINDSVKYGISIGSHTHSHATLTKLSNDEILFELEHSRELIRSNVSFCDCNTIAFPNGKYDKNVADIALSLGYKYLLSTEESSFRYSDIPEVLPRFSLYSNRWWKNYLRLMIMKNLK
jgi:peptidoglycan/xylan/chitin deacetylase (PgdA/CDA1 family)